MGGDVSHLKKNGLVLSISHDAQTSDVNHLAQHATNPPACEKKKPLLAEHSQKEEKHSPPKCSSAGNNHPLSLSLHNCLETTNSGWPENYLPSGSVLQSLSQERCTVSSLSQAHYTWLSDAAGARTPPGLFQLCAQLSRMSSETM